MSWIRDKIVDLFIKLQKDVRRREINSLLRRDILHVGEYTYGVHNLNIQSYKGSEAKVIIGKYCSIGPDVTMVTGGNHKVSWVSTYPFRVKWNLPGKYSDGMPYTNGDIVVGNDVWIGSNSIIMSGVSIGDGAVIAAGGLVTGDVPPYAVVGGIPAKIIKFRFDRELIDALLKIKWWDWDESSVADAISMLSSDQVNEFIDKFLRT